MSVEAKGDVMERKTQEIRTTHQPDLVRFGVIYGLSFAFLMFLTQAANASSNKTKSKVNWAQPPMACVEDIVPRLPTLPCPDLTRVPDPRVDWPEDLPEQDQAYWQSNKRGENYCRSVEIMRREELKPGTFPAGAIQLAWMRLKAIENSEEKVQAVYRASRAQKMPVHVLAGALTQESLFSDLGIAADGGNYSCGIGQVNLSEWCGWANKQTAQKKTEMGWPTNINCSSVSAGLIRPFYEIAKKRLNGLPEYRLDKTHFQNIPLKSVVGGFPAGSTALQNTRYRAAVSFLNHCTDVMNGIAAKANELRNLYVRHVPSGLKASGHYAPGEEFQQSCREKGYTGAYPMNAGWLLAVGIYNAGPRAVDALSHYNKWTQAEIAKPEVWKSIGPVQLVEAFYWSGKYSQRDDRIHIKTLNGKNSSWIWFKPCVLQRHIARVVQHVTLPGFPKLVDTLEGSYKCARSVFNPETGELIQSAVPPFRQKSSGVKEEPKPASSAARPRRTKQR